MKRYLVLTTLIILVYNRSTAQTFRDRIRERREQRNQNATPGAGTSAPDYSNLYYWAAHPAKWDEADSIPAFLKNEARDTSVDVFFLHPTTFTMNFQNAAMNADVNDSALNHHTDVTTILFQASVFNGSCRVFAPRYRQAHLKAYFKITSDESQKAFDLAYEDLKTAFQYYLDHWNHGRPIIIAAHSQGSMHALRLLKEFFDGKPLQKQLVCAYVVGYQIKKEAFTVLPFCNSPGQTGCVLGWRSFKKDKDNVFIRQEEGDALCVNPISWTTDNQWTPKEMHKGAVGKDFNVLIPKKLSVAIAPKENIVWVEIPDDIEQGSSLASGMGNFHIADYNLFWMDIRQNVQQRVAAYFKR